MSRIDSHDGTNICNVLQDADQLSQCVYSIAIASLVPGPQHTVCIQWLREHYNDIATKQQRQCLSWQDIYISTYATAIALRGAGYLDEADRLIAQLYSLAGNTTASETLTFGGIVGALDRFSTNAFGRATSHPGVVQTVIEDESRKLQKMLQWPELYNPRRSIIGFTGESVYGIDGIDLDKYVDAFGMPNGSISSLPSSSAMAVLNHIQHGKQVPADLQKYVSTLNPYIKAVGVLDQIFNYTTAWILMYAQPWRHELTEGEEVKILHNAVNQSALLCATPEATYPGDLDTGTAAMLGLGMPMAECQSMIERASDEMFNASQGCYRTFLFERNASVSTNVHILAAWPDNPRADAIFDWLAAELEGPCDNWTCKWHVSPYYVAGEIRRLLCTNRHPIAVNLVQRADQFLLDTQHSDGGWGMVSSTTEETAYALIALSAHRRELCNDPERIQKHIQRGQTFLHNLPDYTPLWIGKTLYCVRPLVRTLQHAALYHLPANS